jgi:hypothetical protein
LIDSCARRVERAEADVVRYEGAYDFQNAMLFLDELVGAPQSVQGAAYQLILDRKVGEYTLPSGVSIVAAGNRATDRAVVHPMPKPLQNRFVHLNLDVDFNDWQSWAIGNNINASVIGYLTATPQHLFDFDPKSQSMAFPTPRSWKFVSNLLNKSTLSAQALHPLIAGTIGDGVAIEFINHLKMAEDLPNPQRVLAGLEKKLKSKEISVKYSLTISLCYLIKQHYDNALENERLGKNAVAKNGEELVTMEMVHGYIDNYFRFMLDNFEEEMCVLGAKTIFGSYKIEFQPEKVKNFTVFFERFGDMILEC